MAKLISQVKGFVTKQNNAGARGLELVMTCVDHMFEHGDWTPLAWLLAKTDARDNSILRAIVREVTGGISLSTSSKDAKEQPSGMAIKMAGNAAPSEKMSILRELVKEGVSFRSGAVRERLMDKSAPEFDLKAYAKRLQSKLDKEGVTVADLLNAFEQPTPAKKAA